MTSQWTIRSWCTWWDGSAGDPEGRGRKRPRARPFGRAREHGSHAAVSRVLCRRSVCLTPRSLTGARGRRSTCPAPRPFLWAARCRAAQAVYPRPTAARTGREPSPKRGPGTLLDLARGGVCRASGVTVGAVGSYPTLSPLPRVLRRVAVCFLWHCPSSPTLPPFRAGFERRVGVTHRRVLSCSDFPRRRARKPCDAAALLRVGRFYAIRSPPVRGPNPRPGGGRTKGS